MENTKMEFKDKIKELRVKLNLSQVKFAEKLSFGPGTVNHYERGNSNPPKENLKEIIRVYELPQDYFIGCYFDKENRPKKKKEKIEEGPRHVILHHTPKKYDPSIEDAKIKKIIVGLEEEISKLKIRIELLSEIAEKIKKISEARQ
jgi:transcriptional regulator with XRE-family HTH domain